MPHEFEHVRALLVAEAQDTGEGVQHGRRGLPAPLLQARVVVGADRGQQRDLLPAQPLDPALRTAVREPGLAG